MAPEVDRAVELAAGISKIELKDTPHDHAHEREQQYYVDAYLR